jgi:di/tricarboxylate transporter
MELDDLRRAWKHPAAAEVPTAFNKEALEKLLARNSGSLIGRMRHNAWVESSFTVVCLLLSGVALVYVQQAEQRANLVWFVILCLVSIFSYHRHTLQNLTNVDGALHEHITQQVSQLRTVMRLSYRSSLWSLPVSLGIGFFFKVNRIMQELAGQKLLMALGTLVVGYAIAGLLGYLLMSQFGRWYLQRLYGQHLDRLEALLQELEE